MIKYKYVCCHIQSKQEFTNVIEFLLEIDFYKFLDKCNDSGRGKWQYWRK